MAGFSPGLERSERHYPTAYFRASISGSSVSGWPWAEAGGPQGGGWWWIETRCLGGLYWKDQSRSPARPATWRLVRQGCPTPREAGLSRGACLGQGSGWLYPKPRALGIHLEVELDPQTLESQLQNFLKKKWVVEVWVGAQQLRTLTLTFGRGSVSGDTSFWGPCSFPPSSPHSCSFPGRNRDKDPQGKWRIFTLPALTLFLFPKPCTSSPKFSPFLLFPSSS